MRGDTTSSPATEGRSPPSLRPCPVGGGRSPCQRWMESPIRGGWNPPSEMDGVPHQRRTEHHVPEALPWPRPPVLLGLFPGLRP